MARAETDALAIKTLGGLAIARNGAPVDGFASRKAEALLVYLACRRQEHPREVLADFLWDDRTQRRAMANSRVVLSSLRQEVGPYVTITRTSAAINAGADVQLDVARLAAAAARLQAEGARPEPDAVEETTATIDQYRGDFLEGFFLPDASGFEGWATAERERLHRLVLDALQRLADRYLQQGNYAATISWATRAVTVDPLFEAGHRYLMEVLARNGQRADALAQFERCREILVDELGLEIVEPHEPPGAPAFSFPSSPPQSPDGQRRRPAASHLRNRPAPSIGPRDRG